MTDNKRNGLATLRKYFRKYRSFYLWGLLVLIGSSGFKMIAPRVFGEGMDILRTGADQSALFWYALAFVGAAVVSGIFHYYARRTIIWASRHLEFDLRNELFNHLLKLSATFYQRTPTGDIIARASNDMEAVRMLAGPAVMYFINSVVTAILALTMMFSISSELTLYTLIPLPLLSLAMWGISVQIHRRFRKIQDHFSYMSSFVQESVAGVRVIKAYRRREYQEKRFTDINHKYVFLNMSLARVRAFFMPCVVFLAGTVYVLVLWIGGYQVIEGDITLGDFVAINIYLQMMIWPMLAFGWVTSMYQRGKASLARIDEILDERPDVFDGPNLTQATKKSGIRFDNLSFTYPSTSTPVLRNVSFEVEPGQRIAIVGATGSGKSTLVSLLMRRYPVPDKSIFLGGVDVNSVPLDNLRSQFGVVPQESYLFSDTIESNISLGAQRTDEESVREVTRMALFDSEVEALPKKHKTVLGERGITLSGGQKQRAAIARALLNKPPILVFDDAFSSVDTQTEELILRNLAEYAGGATMLIISHRPSTIKRADRIVVLEHGTVAEIGTHDELIAKRGRYYDIIRRELLADELETLN